MNRSIVSIFVLVFASFAIRAHAQIPFDNGEELFYNVSYSARLIPPINMMRVTLRTLAENPGGTGGASRYHVIGNGRTTGAAGGIFSLNDTYHTWLDGATLLPVRMTSDIHEDDYHFRATYIYDWNTMTVSNVRRSRNWDADRRATIPLTPDSGDALSLFYRMRSLDPATLTPGREYPLELVLSEDARPIAFRFIGREELTIKKVGTFRALKFTCTMATSDGSTYQEGMRFTVWVSDDANKIPLKIECPIRVGRVTVTLTDGYKVVHPMTSFVK